MAHTQTSRQSSSGCHGGAEGTTTTPLSPSAKETATFQYHCFGPAARAWPKDRETQHSMAVHSKCILMYSPQGMGRI